MTEGSVRGAGRSRGGATDTTMLIWKVIAANPGITRAGIWEHVEHSIPEGYAMRRYANSSKYRAGDSARTLRAARSFILSKILADMRHLGSIRTEGHSRGRGFTTVHEPAYRGNPDAIDETGTKAAEHMATADALRAVEKMIARAKPGGHGPAVCANRKEYEAIVLLVKALRARPAG